MIFNLNLANSSFEIVSDFAMIGIILTKNIKLTLSELSNDFYRFLENFEFEIKFSNS
jgi:hypothetical protein